MHESYHKWYSQYINREFDMLVFGSGGIPVIFFPPAKERYYYAKDSGFTSAASELINNGKIKIYTPDSFDAESWYNYEAEPSDRVKHYKNFESLIIHDIIGFIKYETNADKVILAGEGFGGYHALNFGLKHPDMASGIITLGSFFNIKQFIYGYYDDNCYFNNPPDYLPGLDDEWYLTNINKLKIHLAADINDEFFEENRNISFLLSSKGIPNQLIITDIKNISFSWKDLFSSILTSFIKDNFLNN
jgi:esterase/lipase superfamily enzyme